MFKGFILSESLKNPTVLNLFKQIKVIIENHPEHAGEPKIWHDFEIIIEDNNIARACDQVSMEMKEGWYAHFWDKNTLYVVLPNKVFKMPREDGSWKSKEYLECKKYAMNHGVEERYLKDFLIDD